MKDHYLLRTKIINLQVGMSLSWTSTLANVFFTNQSFYQKKITLDGPSHILLKERVKKDKRVADRAWTPEQALSLPQTRPTSTWNIYLHRVLTALDIKCKEKMEPQEAFYYRSVSGMLQYLTDHIRPDITLAVSQCTRYSNSPKRSHEIALLSIGQYLRGTKDKGIFFNPQRQDETT
jgi:hypothetical protein